MTDREERVAVAERAARAGGAVAAESFRQGIAVETKDGKTDVVTRADRDAQERVVEVIREAYPDDAIVGEEGDAATTVPDEGAAWIVDPIDGTNNFVRGVNHWVTSVAATVDGEPVAAANAMPALDDVYVAGGSGATRNGEPIAVSDRTDPETFRVSPIFRWDYDERDAYAAILRGIVERFDDQQRLGAAQYALSLVAAGALEGAASDRRPSPWDAVAGVHLIREAGGVVTDIDGDRWRHDGRGLVASNGERHDAVLAAARAALA